MKWLADEASEAKRSNGAFQHFKSQANVFIPLNETLSVFAAENCHFEASYAKGACFPISIQSRWKRLDLLLESQKH